MGRFGDLFFTNNGNQFFFSHMDFMRQRGGSVVNSSTVFTIVVVIAVFNVIAYMHVKDWSSIAVFLLAGGVTFSVTMNRTLGVVAAIVAGSLFRATNNLMIEGMASDKSVSPKPTLPKGAKSKRDEVKKPVAKQEAEPVKNKYADFLGSEGMSTQLDQLQNNQAVLTNGIKALQPLMQQASAMLKGLPSGFLDEALKNFSKNNGQI